MFSLIVCASSVKAPYLFSMSCLLHIQFDLKEIKEKKAKHRHTFSGLRTLMVAAVSLTCGL